MRGLLQIHQHPLEFLLARSNIFNKRSSKSCIDSIPVDVILEIAEFLQTSDVLNFSLTSSHFRSALIPTLYAKVDLRSSRQCRIVLAVLVQRPDITRHIRELIVRPNYYLAWPKADEPLDELRVVKIIQSIASELHTLHTFAWDGLEMPHDEIWLTLRDMCPRLRTVSSSVGMRPLNPESNFFSFTGLHGFELMVRCGLSGADVFPLLEDLPERLWDMLLNRCPDLEDLIISCPSASPRLFDFQPVISARWPKLRRLNLGCVGYQSDFTVGPAIDLKFAPFLVAHPTLETLAFQWNYSRWWSPESFPMALPVNAIPHLRNFSGLYQQLAEIPSPTSIETVDLTFEPIPSMRLTTACDVLKNLTSLNTLDIWLYIPNNPGELTQVFQSLLMSCPKLNDLHIMCTSPFTVKPLKLLSHALKLLPALTSFSLTKGHKYRDEDMMHSALRILRANQRLKQIMIRWVRQSCPNHCKQIGTYDVIFAENGRPLSLLVRERGVWLIGKDFSRRYKYELPFGWDRKPPTSFVLL